MQAKSKLYARRLKGDLDLGLEPARIGGDGRQQWARMDFPGGRIPGQPDQLITESSALPRFGIGTKRVEYGRTFRYSRAGGDITTAQNALMVANGNWRPGFGGSYPNWNGFWSSLNVEATLGDQFLDLFETTYTPAGMLPRALNYYQGAYICIFVLPFNVHYVVSSDLGGAAVTRIYLDHPIIQATIPVANQVEINLSPYSNVIDGTGVARFKSFIGKPLLNVASGRYFWCQTAGPAWIQPSSWVDDRTPGRAANYRAVYAHLDGSIVTAFAADPSAGYQRVGYLLSATEVGEGAAYIMMQLDAG